MRHNTYSWYIGSKMNRLAQNSAMWGNFICIIQNISVSFSKISQEFIITLSISLSLSNWADLDKLSTVGIRKRNFAWEYYVRPFCIQNWMEFEKIEEILDIEWKTTKNCPSLRNNIAVEHRKYYKIKNNSSWSYTSKNNWWTS